MVGHTLRLSSIAIKEASREALPTQVLMVLTGSCPLALNQPRHTALLVFPFLCHMLRRRKLRRLSQVVGDTRANLNLSTLDTNAPNANTKEYSQCLARMHTYIAISRTTQTRSPSVSARLPVGGLHFYNKIDSRWCGRLYAYIPSETLTPPYSHNILWRSQKNIFGGTPDSHHHPQTSVDAQ